MCLTKYEIEYQAAENKYESEYSKGEYCHKQSFLWGFQEGIEYIKQQKLINNNSNYLEFWIARDKNKNLKLYSEYPVKIDKLEVFLPDYHSFMGVIEINKDLFPEIVWENSPKKVKIELIEDNLNK